MEFIGGNFSSKKVNFKSKDLKVTKEDKKLKEVEVKKVEAKMLDVLASYNKASIHFRGNNQEEYNRKSQELSDKFNEAFSAKVASGLISKISEDNIDFAYKTFLEENEDGYFAYEDSDKLCLLWQEINKENANFAMEYCFGKYKDIFQDPNISIDDRALLLNVNSQNEDIAELIMQKLQKDEYDLNYDNIPKLLQAAINGKDFVCNCLAIKGADSRAIRELLSEMHFALNKISKKGFDFLNEILFVRDKGNDFYPVCSLDEIAYNAEQIDETNYDFFRKIFFAKDEYGHDLYRNKIRIGDIVAQYSETEAEYSKRRKERISKCPILKIDKNQYNFENFQQRKREFLEKLYFAKDEKGNDLFDAKDYGIDIIEEIYPDNIELAERLCFSKDKNGNYVFQDRTMIQEVLEFANFSNIDFVEKLVSAKNVRKTKRRNPIFGNMTELLPFTKHKEKNSPRFNGAMINDILQAINNLNCIFVLENEKTDASGTQLKKFNTQVLNLVEKFYFGKNKNPRLLDDNQILNILDRLNIHNIVLVEKLYIGRDENGKELFSEKDEIEDILGYTYKGNIVLAEKLCFGRDENGRDLFPLKHEISNILEYTDEKNVALAEKLCFGKCNDGNDYCPDKSMIPAILKSNLPQQKIEQIFELCHSGELSFNCIPLILEGDTEFDYKKYKILKRAFGKEELEKLSVPELALACKIVYLAKKNNINEIDLAHKKEVLKNIISKNTDLFSCDDKFKKMFPLLPENQEQYCALVSSLAKSIGIETNEISKEENEIFNISLNQLSMSLADLSDREFNDLEFHQEYPKTEFMKNVFNLVKDMNPKERQKVYDYFGFELKPNKHGLKLRDDVHTRFSIVGYPVNLNNGKKLAQIDNQETKQIIEKLRPEVIRFSENNHVTCSDKTIEKAINEILKICPEIRTEIGKVQHDAHEFDVFKNSLKVLQKIVQNPEFEKLNDSDKKIMLLASLLHSITKIEGVKDVMHANESAFDGFYISKKFDLTHDEEIKLYSLIKNYEWFRYVNSNPEDNQDIKEEKLKSVAYDLQYDNLFEMSKIFTEADLKAVKKDDGFFDKYSEAFEEKSQSIQAYINELKTTQPLLPVTKIPSTSRIKQAITMVNPDYSTNLKGIYQDENGMVIIRYNEVENETWGKIGFDKGTISKGVETVNYKNKKVNTGNIKFFAHGLDEMWQLQNFDAFQLPDSDALLSVSYMELPESKYRLFRNQGVLLDTDTKYEHGGGNTDSGSGCKKALNIFKKDYAYHGSCRHEDRTYVSDLIKETLDMTDEEYMEFVKANKNKSISEIEPKEYQKKIIEAFATINSNRRHGNREYNEMYITNPTIMGVFAYPFEGDLSNFTKFVKSRPEFLKEYALDNDIPFVIFGN